MGNQSNRILPHQDPAVTSTTARNQQTSRRMRQRQNTLRRSWNAQEQPRRRVQRRSSVKKYNLEDSLAKVQQEEEQQQKVVSTAAEQNPHLSVFRAVVVLAMISPKNSYHSRNSVQVLHEIQPYFGGRYHCADTSTTPSTTMKRSGSSSVHRSCQQQESCTEKSKDCRTTQTMKNHLK